MTERSVPDSIIPALKVTINNFGSRLDQNPDFRNFNRAAVHVADRMINGWNVWLNRYGRKRPQRAQQEEVGLPPVTAKRPSLEASAGSQVQIDQAGAQAASALGERVAAVEQTVDSISAQTSAINSSVTELGKTFQGLSERVGNMPDEITGRVDERVSRLEEEMGRNLAEQVEAVRQNLSRQFGEEFERMRQELQRLGISDDELNRRMSSEVNRQLSEREQRLGRWRRFAIVGAAITGLALALGSGFGGGWIANDLVKDKEPVRQDVNGMQLGTAIVGLDNAIAQLRKDTDERTNKVEGRLTGFEEEQKVTKGQLDAILSQDLPRTGADGRPRTDVFPVRSKDLTDEQIRKILGDEIVIAMDASRRPEGFDTGDWGGIRRINELTGIDLRKYDPTGLLDWQIFDALARDSGYPNGSSLNLLRDGQTLRLKVGPLTIGTFRQAEVPLGEVARSRLSP